MAYFQALTAEEEAAAALFHSLQRQGYTRARRLRWRNHLHKASVSVFLDAIALAFRTMQPSDTKVQLLLGGKRRGHGVSLLISRGGSGKEAGQYGIDHPFEFGSTVDGHFDDFLEEVGRVAKASNLKMLETRLKDRTHRRNRALYASESGIPRFQGDISRHLEAMRNVVFRILLMFIIVDLEAGRQKFAQQALDGYLKLMDAVTMKGALRALGDEAEV
jgi:hypothetical protein